MKQSDLKQAVAFLKKAPQKLFASLLPGDVAKSSVKVTNFFAEPQTESLFFKKATAFLARSHMAKMRSKSELPAKICLHCARPFTWRKKWARDWDNVKYCSERCRNAPAQPPAKPRPDPR